MSRTELSFFLFRIYGADGSGAMKKSLEVVAMAWQIETYKVFYKGEVILEKHEPLTTSDIYNAAKIAGISGKFDVYDENGTELFPSDFPYAGGNVIIVPRFTAGF